MFNFLSCSIWLFFKKVAKSGLKISYFWWIKLFSACFIASSIVLHFISPLIQPFKFLIEIITSLFLFPSSSKKVVIMLELPLHWTLFLLIRAFLWDKMLIFLLFTGLVTKAIIFLVKMLWLFTNPEPKFGVSCYWWCPGISMHCASKPEKSFSSFKFLKQLM